MGIETKEVKDYIERIAGEIEGVLNRFQEIEFEELHTDRDKRNMVLHAMLISIQSAIDIANHIIADKGLRKPSTYRESFEILYEERLIPKVLSDRLSDLAGFRNILVHIYLRLDIDAVYEVLQRDLSALKEYERAVKRLLQGGGTG